MMLVLLREHFLLIWMRDVSSAAVTSTHAWDGEIFGKSATSWPWMRCSGAAGRILVGMRLRICSVPDQAIKVAFVCSCGENWARHLFRRSESANRVRVFQRFGKRERVKTARGNCFCKSQVANFPFGSDPHKLDPLTSGDEIERNPLCFLISQRKRKSWLMSTDILFSKKPVYDIPSPMMQKADLENCSRF